MPTITRTDIDRIREHLANAAFLYESPDAFEAGVDATVEALEALASVPVDRSDLPAAYAGAVGTPGVVLELDDLDATTR